MPNSVKGEHADTSRSLIGRIHIAMEIDFGKNHKISHKPNGSNVIDERIVEPRILIIGNDEAMPINVLIAVFLEIGRITYDSERTPPSTAAPTTSVGGTIPSRKTKKCHQINRKNHVRNARAKSTTSFPLTNEPTHGIKKKERGEYPRSP